MERTKKSGGELPEEEETPKTGLIKEEKEPPKTYVDPDPIIPWRKVGGGSLHLEKRLIKPNEVFRARASEIPKAFLDLVIPLTSLPNIPVQSGPPPVKNVYKVVPRGKSKSQFDIVDSFGKRVNEQPLTKAVAEQLLNDMAR